MCKVKPKPIVKPDFWPLEGSAKSRDPNPDIQYLPNLHMLIEKEQVFVNARCKCRQITVGLRCDQLSQTSFGDGQPQVVI